MRSIKFSQTFFLLSIACIFSTNASAGSITGTVKFDGSTPNFKEIRMDADPICLGFHKDPVYPQSLLTGEGSTLGNVLVQIKNPPPGNYLPPSDPIVIDQKGCNYHPRVSAAMVNQPVKVLNPDGTLHNVHALPKVNQEFNVAMPKFRTEITKTFDKAEPAFQLKCDVHPWMQGWLAVLPHPFFHVTGADGKFEIKNVADGTYTVEIWHEKLGTQTASVTVTGGASTVDFTMVGPKRKEE